MALTPFRVSFWPTSFGLTRSFVSYLAFDPDRKPVRVESVDKAFPFGSAEEAAVWAWKLWTSCPAKDVSLAPEVVDDGGHGHRVTDYVKERARAVTFITIGGQAMPRLPEYLANMWRQEEPLPVRPDELPFERREGLKAGEMGILFAVPDGKAGPLLRMLAELKKPAFEMQIEGESEGAKALAAQRDRLSARLAEVEVERDGLSVKLTHTTRSLEATLFERDDARKLALASDPEKVGTIAKLQGALVIANASVKRRGRLVAQLREALQAASAYVCAHEERHRGGAIWEICGDCGMSWADDKGGFKPDPARELIDKALSAASHFSHALTPAPPGNDGDESSEVEDKTLPCPFCGSFATNIQDDFSTPLHPDEVRSHTSFWGYCVGCAAEGPWDETREGALAKWNRRAP